MSLAGTGRGLARVTEEEGEVGEEIGEGGGEGEDVEKFGRGGGMGRVSA